MLGELDKQIQSRKPDRLCQTWRITNVTEYTYPGSTKEFVGLSSFGISSVSGVNINYSVSSSDILGKHDKKLVSA